MIYDLPKWAYVQALLSNGDRRVAKILLAVHRNKGDWGKALRESSVNPDSSSIGQETLTRSSHGFHRPWHLKRDLKKEYLKAMEEAGTTPITNDQSPMINSQERTTDTGLKQERLMMGTEKVFFDSEGQRVAGMLHLPESSESSVCDRLPRASSRAKKAQSILRLASNWPRTG